jgi:hypothetical protein
MLDFLLAPDDALGGDSPLDVIRRGDQTGAVRRLLNVARIDVFG